MILIVCLVVMISLIAEDIFYAIMNFVLCCIVIFDIGLYIDIFNYIYVIVVFFLGRNVNVLACEHNLVDSCKDNIMHGLEFESQTQHFSIFKMCKVQQLDYLTKSKNILIH